MNIGVGLTMEVLIGKLSRPTEKHKQELIIRFVGEIASELLKRVADQPRTNIEERFTGMHFKRFLEGY
jgi:hypothetical protein